MATTLNHYEDATVPTLARWAQVSEDEARAHVVMVKDVTIEVRTRFGYTTNSSRKARRRHGGATDAGARRPCGRNMTSG